MIVLLRGIRGATTVEKDDSINVAEAVQEMLTALIEANQLDTSDIGAVIFSSTPDLNSAFPAAGARALGWSDVPLFGTVEIDNPNGIIRCIRVLILYNTTKSQQEIRHVYLRRATALRPDIA
ncbi:chorismate mutase [Sporomusaceae bacterium BoRhaA]|uniref:chorismate mutase n=1 Tax=Pelorhabdus rhamnosifermentans TaxID=2772457 RepID=UPI001C06104C|nr:chorismate mutase [Pelorhabdus rhamnosifermentans]MBU2701525.1 chorismate mutase [Pelorhabdus rhamnosifermentans]